MTTVNPGVNSTNMNTWTGIYSRKRNRRCPTRNLCPLYIRWLILTRRSKFSMISEKSGVSFVNRPLEKSREFAGIREPDKLAGDMVYSLLTMIMLANFSRICLRCLLVPPSVEQKDDTKECWSSENSDPSTLGSCFSVNRRYVWFKKILDIPRTECCRWNGKIKAVPAMWEVWLMKLASFGWVLFGLPYMESTSLSGDQLSELKVFWSGCGMLKRTVPHTNNNSIHSAWLNHKLVVLIKACPSCRANFFIDFFYH